MRYGMSDKYYNEDGSLYSYREKKKREKSTQENWNEYYKDKQWIDTKGWCDLDGNPLPLGHKLPPKPSEIIINDSSNAFGLESPFSFLKRNKPHKASEDTFRPQDHWEKYNIDKQWIDGKGWCDMNGVKINSKYQAKPNNLYKISFRETVLEALKRIGTLFGIYILTHILQPNNIFTNFLALVFVVGSIGFIIYYGVKILINFFKGNLKF